MSRCVVCDCPGTCPRVVNLDRLRAIAMLRSRKERQRGLEPGGDLGQARDDVYGLGVVGHGVWVKDGREGGEVLGVDG